MSLILTFTGIWYSRKNPDIVVRMIIMTGGTLLIYTVIPAQTSDASYTAPTPTMIQWQFIHNDHLGTPIMVTNEEGQKVWEAQYSPFGEIVETNYQQTTDFNLRFPGQYHDRETGLYYNWNRYYSAELGRYITSDPIGLGGGLNTYGYALGDPINYYDPNGLMVPMHPMSGYTLARAQGQYIKDHPGEHLNGVIHCQGGRAVPHVFEDVSECVRDCVRVHEQFHADYHNHYFPKVCSTHIYAYDGAILGYSNFYEKTLHEVQAAMLEISCLKKKLRENESCENDKCQAIIQDHIESLENDYIRGKGAEWMNSPERHGTIPNITPGYNK